MSEGESGVRGRPEDGNQAQVKRREPGVTSDSKPSMRKKPPKIPAVDAKSAGTMMGTLLLFRMPKTAEFKLGTSVAGCEIQKINENQFGTYRVSPNFKLEVSEKLPQG